MNWYKQANQYEYIGDCRDTVDQLGMWDATQMAQLVENSSSLSPQKLIPFIDSFFGNQIMESPDNFEAGEYQSIIWFYNIETDIHYFFRK